MATELSIGPGVAMPDALLVNIGGLGWVEAPATLTPLGEALRNLCATKLAVIANKRQARIQPYISRWNELAEIAAEVYDATNADPHGDLSWRDDVELPY